MPQYLFERCRHGLGLGPNPLLVLETILTEDGVGLCLRGVLDVGVVEQLLDAHQDLLDGDSGAPVLLVIKQGEADGPGGVNVGVEERRLKLALGWG